MIRVGILGAKGYAAGEAARWLLAHPEFDLTCLMARVERPEPVSNYFPALRGQTDLMIETMDLKALADACDAAILGLPHTTSQEYATELIRSGVKVIDLSADFRFDSPEAFASAYGVAHKAPELNAQFPYAQPELFADEIPGAAGLACPGCYPTATMLGLAPIMKHALRFDLDHIVVNALSGTSGAGRKAEERYSFCEVNESVAAYGVGNHRHRPEIEEKLSRVAGAPIRLTFTPHLMPMNRGILATSVVPLLAPVTAAEVQTIYADFYDGKPFVRLLPPGKNPQTADVTLTNFCDIGLTIDNHSKVLIIVSAIDNLAKGAASQAIQAMNILYGFPETMGLLPRRKPKAAQG